jgi:hypothetical protein
MTVAPGPRRRSDAPWDLSFLRVGALITAPIAAAAAAVTGLVAGWPHAAGVLLGAAVVIVFFCVSGLVVAWAGRIDDSFTLPAAVGTFLLKAVVLFAMLSALPFGGWLDRRTLAWTVVVGALLWSGIQLRWVWTRKLYYVPPPVPPTPSRPASGEVVPDPERPVYRG